MAVTRMMESCGGPYAPAQGNGFPKGRRGNLAARSPKQSESLLFGADLLAPVRLRQAPLTIGSCDVIPR